MRCVAAAAAIHFNTYQKKKKKILLKSTCSSPPQRLQNPRSSSLTRLDKIAYASTQLRNCFSTDKPQVSFVHFPTWHIAFVFAFVVVFLWALFYRQISKL